MKSHIAVVGASLAGLHAARGLRAAGFDGKVSLIGAEARLPYDRPPLSKGVLRGVEVEADIALCEHGIVAEGVDLQLGRTATALDLGERRLSLDDGSTVRFDGLIIATGARPRRMVGQAHFEGVYMLRDLEDARALRAAFERVPGRVVVVGAGFIGAEVAAAARGCGLDVTLVEMLPAPCVRGLGLSVGTALARLYRENGIDLRLDTGVAGIDGNGKVERVRFSDGSAVDADVVVIGIGVVPNVEWLEGSGLALNDGVLCDATCLAAPGVSVAGDVARRPNGRFGGTLRVEHWDNAIAQGGAAARRLLTDDDGAESFDPVPWFWSDQFGWNVQLAGHPAAQDSLEIVSGELGKPPFAAVYERDGRASAFVGVNAPALVRKARRLLAKSATVAELRALR